MALIPRHHSPFRVFFLFCAAVAGAGVSASTAGEVIEHFILPETPPIIERVKRPPIDRPLVRRQNFLPEEEGVILPPALLGVRFFMPGPDSRPLTIGASFGSCASAGGYMTYVSSAGWQLSMHGFSTEGETPRFSGELSGARWEGERSVTPSIRARARASVDNNRVWTQKQRRAVAGGGIDWYVAPSLKLNAEAEGGYGEISGDDANTRSRIFAGSQWQPWEGHSLSLTASRLTNTAFANERDIPEAEILYLLMLGRDISCGAGGRFQKNDLYPEARADWHIDGVFNVAVTYRPGIDVLSWDGLYGDGRFVAANSGLLFPRSEYFFSETFGFHAGGRDLIELELHQGAWRDYPCWFPVSGADAIMPVTIPEAYIAGGTLALRHNGKMFAPSLSVVYNANASLPLVPEVEIRTSVSWKPSPWSVTAAYGYIDPRTAGPGGSGILPAAHDVSMEVSREIDANLVLSVAGRNLLGRDIEMQPGFRRKGTQFETRLSASF